MASATGSWAVIEDLWDDIVASGAAEEGTEGAEVGTDVLEVAEVLARKSNKSIKSNKQRLHHYAFDVDDNGLDINGFILQTDKHKGKRQKFRVYLDSNENGRFDKNDQLIGRTGLKQKHAAKGVGNLLDEGEIGQLEVKYKKPDGSLAIVQRSSESNASMRGTDDIDAQMFGGSGGDGGTAGNVSVTNLSFSDPNGDPVADFNDAYLGVHTLGAKAAWGQLH